MVLSNRFFERKLLLRDVESFHHRFPEEVHLVSCYILYFLVKTRVLKKTYTHMHTIYVYCIGVCKIYGICIFFSFFCIFIIFFIYTNIECK